MQLIVIDYPDSRLNFFKEQLAAANRRLDWSMKHNPDWNDHVEKGEEVNFYEWAVKMAEGDHEAVVRCRDCDLQSGCKVAQRLGNVGYCSNGERKDGDG